jgi:hypothetical protein
MARDDIRLDINFFEHPKTKRLIRVLGHKGFYALVRLWTSSAKLYPKGIFKDLDEVDIAELAGWDEDPTVFCKGLSDPKINFLEKVDGIYSLHGWEEHQPWIYYQNERSEIARQNARKRWAMQSADDRHTEGNANSNPEATAGGNADGSADSMQSASDAKGNTDRSADGIADCTEDDAIRMQTAEQAACNLHTVGNAPSPSPSPSPTPIPKPIPIPKNSGELKVSPPSGDEQELTPPEPPPSPPARRSTPGDTELYTSVQKAFLSKNGEKFTDYGKEGKAIKQLIKKAKARDPDAHDEFLKSMITRFWELKAGKDRFWKSQPFLPSALNAGGIFDRVLETFRDPSGGADPPPGELDQEFLQLIKQAEAKREGVGV